MADNSKHVTIDHFRGAAAEIELPPCCAKLIKKIDDGLMTITNVKETMFVAAFYQVFAMIFAGPPKVVRGKIKEPGAILQEVGIAGMGDGIQSANKAPDLPEYVAGLNQIARQTARKLIQPHLVNNSHAGCKHLGKTKKFWTKMLEAFA